MIISNTQRKMMRAMVTARKAHSWLLIEPKNHQTIRSLHRRGWVECVEPTPTTHMKAKLTAQGSAVLLMSRKDETYSFNGPTIAL